MHARSLARGIGTSRRSWSRVEPAQPSFGQLHGLHSAADSLELKSGVALVIDQDTDEVLFSKNSQAVLPIASLTKLMTAVVVTEANLPLDEPITITDDDIDTEKFSRSRLRVGTHAAPRGDAAPRADVVREPRRARARPHLSRRPRRLRRGDERARRARSA